MPHPENEPWAKDPFAALATDEGRVVALAKQLIQGDTSGNAVPLLGEYLTALLLGPAWEQLESSLAGKPESIELGLQFDPDSVMQRLPWEMMMHCGKPLGALQGRTVAITRLVDGPASGKIQISIPLRILIAIGMQFDQSLRPGAEYIGILRRLQAARGGEASGGAPPQSIDVNIRLLPSTTVEDLAAAITEFDPSVVHFIAHGQQIEKQPVIILTCPSATEIGKSEADPCGPLRLAQAMRRKDGTGKLPPVVVLNACHTGEHNAEYVPFAAALVREGIPVALGMAGEVADAASRAFTKAFYQSLIDGRPLAESAAEARRAVMLQPDVYDFLHSAEWVRPTLFMAAAAAPEIAVDPGRRQIAAAAFRFRTLREPAVICDRMQTFQAYERHRRRIAAGEYRSPMVLEVSDNERSLFGDEKTSAKLQIGKSRALSEIAANSVLDGMLPCVIGEALQRPLNLLAFAVRVAEVMDDSREYFGLPRQVRSTALETAFLVCRNTPQTHTSKPPQQAQPPFDAANLLPYKLYRDTVKSWLNQPEVPPPEADIAMDAIKADSEMLLADVNRATSPSAQAADGYFQSVLLLIDDLHQYAAIAKPLLMQALKTGLAGMGGRVALAFSYSTMPDAGPEIAEYIKDNRRAFAIESLRPFQSPAESRLAYTQFMLARQAPLAPSARQDHAPQLDVMFKYLHDRIRGVPSFFALGEQTITLGRDLGLFVDADDEKLIVKI